MTTRSKRPKNLTSHSELSTLAQCEMKHHLRYVEHLKGDDGDALILGRLVDKAGAAFWRGDSWEDALICEVAAPGVDPRDVDPYIWDSIDEMHVEAKAYWLMQRYARHYESMLASVKVVAQQLDVRAKIPGTAQVHQAIIDDIWEVNGRYWMVERKTYGRNDRVDMVEVDPQLTNNLWVARANGYDCVGIVFDGIYTYRWKTEKPTLTQLEAEITAGDWGGGTKQELRALAKQLQERHPGVDRPDEDSFTQLWLDRTPEHIAAAQKDIRAGISRRNALRRGATPVRNLGPLCKNCGQKPECFGRLAFPQDVEIVVED